VKDSFSLIYAHLYPCLIHSTVLPQLGLWCFDYIFDIN